MSRGLPAKDDDEEYGESPGPGGPTGRICHQLWPAAARKSTKARAEEPRSPPPWGPGSEVMCSRRPLARRSRRETDDARAGAGGLGAASREDPRRGRAARGGGGPRGADPEPEHTHELGAPLPRPEPGGGGGRFARLPAPAARVRRQGPEDQGGGGPRRGARAGGQGRGA